jgi:hypothetical protein
MRELNLQYSCPMPDSQKNLPERWIVTGFELFRYGFVCGFKQSGHLPEFGFPLGEHIRPGNEFAALDFTKYIFGALAGFQHRFLLGEHGTRLVPVLGCGDDRFAQGGAIHAILTGLNQAAQVLDDAHPVRQACALSGGSESSLTSHIDPVRRCSQRRLARRGTGIGL